MKISAKNKIILSVFAVFCAAAVIVPYVKTAYVSAPVYYTNTILLDAGHGFPDGGAVGGSGSVESDLNLDITLKLQKLLEKSGFYVILTRADKNAVAEIDGGKKIREIKREDLKNRRNMRDGLCADAFISIHLNKFTEPQYKGAQVFYSSDNTASKALGNSIQHSLKEILDKENNRAAKESGTSIFVLKGAQIPSVLVEAGFLSNSEEEKLLNSNKYRQKIAWAIFCGVINYFK